MSANSDACTAPPDHRMARTPHHFGVWAKILELLFNISPQLEKSVWMPCEYTIPQESTKKKIARSLAKIVCNPCYIECTKWEDTHLLLLWIWIPCWLHWHHSPSFNCLNTNTTTLNTVAHDHMYVSNERVLKTILNENRPHFVISLLLDNVAELMQHPVL